DLALHALSTRAAPSLLRSVLGAPIADPVERMGLQFGNRIGLAAGLDKDARAIDAFGAMGFGFVEVGTVTPRGQPGNPKPRLFRLPSHDALINRFGFNNHGATALCERVKRRKWAGLIGINIGKNANTPTENAVDDYVDCLATVAPLADYVTVNVSSPNTKNLRDLQSAEALDTLLGELVSTRDAAAEQRGKPLPLLLKVAPDMAHDQREAIAKAVKAHRIDGLIASNTTVEREAVAGQVHAEESGGLSGGPLRARTPSIIKAWRGLLGSDTTLVAVGGIASAQDAVRSIESGADLVQVYTGLIYHGPRLVKDIAAELRQHGEHKGT
ncbi:MAG: dihydroorotate dehydrogenase (quinone), partial [Pseudomonadota bacterium]